MNLPAGYAVRPATEEDIDAVVALLRTYDRWELGETDASREQLVDDFESPGFDPAHDTWFVTDRQDEPVAFVLYKHGEPGSEGAQGFGRVRPDHHGRGLGAFLVEAAEARWLGDAPERRPAILRHWLNAGDRRAGELLGSHGYVLARREYHLRHSLEDLPEPRVPDGIGLRRFAPGEERALHLVNEEAFARHWGFRPSTFEEWAPIFETSSFVPELVWIAEDAGELVGWMWLQVSENAGWVNVLGVRPRWQRRGIGKALLGLGLSELRRHGCDRAFLGVDAGNQSGALRLYEGVGMTVHREWRVVEKALG